MIWVQTEKTVIRLYFSTSHAINQVFSWLICGLVWIVRSIKVNTSATVRFAYTLALGHILVETLRDRGKILLSSIG